MKILNGILCFGIAAIVYACSGTDYKAQATQTCECSQPTSNAIEPEYRDFLIQELNLGSSLYDARNKLTQTFDKTFQNPVAKDLSEKINALLQKLDDCNGYDNTQTESVDLAEYLKSLQIEMSKITGCELQAAFMRDNIQELEKFQ
jgi:hypothetical protein